MTIRSMTKKPGLIFCSYAQVDRDYFTAFEKHLSGPVRKSGLELWHEGCLRPGDDWQKVTHEKLTRADIIIFLVSADLFVSEFQSDIVLRAVELNKKRVVTIVPVMVRTYELGDTLLAAYYPLPREPALPIKTCPDPDEAWANIVNELRPMLKELSESYCAAASSSGRQSGYDGSERIAYRLAQSRHQTGYDLMYHGHLEDGLKELRAAQAMIQKLIQDHSEKRLWRKELATIHQRIGHASYSGGDLEAAEAEFDVSFKIRCRLREELPDDNEVLHDLCTSRYWRGHLAFIKGDFPRAREEQEAGLVLSEQLSRRDADGGDIPRDRIVLLTDLGSTLQKMGDDATAEKHLREGLELAEENVARYPWHLQAQRDYSVGLFRLADLLLKRGHIHEAHALSLRSVEECERLSTLDPENAQWQRHLASACLRLGDALVRMEDSRGAKEQYRRAAGIMAALVATDSANLQWLDESAVPYCRLGELAAREQEWDSAFEAYRKAVLAREAICTRSPLARRQLELLEVYLAILEAWEASAQPSPERGEVLTKVNETLEALAHSGTTSTHEAEHLFKLEVRYARFMHLQ